MINKMNIHQETAATLVDKDLMGTEVLLHNLFYMSKLPNLYGSSNPCPKKDDIENQKDKNIEVSDLDNLGKIFCLIIVVIVKIFNLCVK